MRRDVRGKERDAQNGDGHVIVCSGGREAQRHDGRAAGRKRAAAMTQSASPTRAANVRRRSRARPMAGARDCIARERSWAARTKGMYI